MESDGKSWLIIALLIAVGIGVAIFFANSAADEEAQAQHVNAVMHSQEAEMHMLRAENEALRAELERLHRGR